MSGKVPYILNRLMQNRLLIWGLSLILILVFLGMLSSIFWFVRMKVSSESEIDLDLPPSQSISQLLHPGELILRTSIPQRPYQIIQPGDSVEVRIGEEIEISGLIQKVESREESVKLTISVQEIEGGEEALNRLDTLIHSRKKPPGVVTLRSVRLIAAFSRSPRR